MLTITKVAGNIFDDTQYSSEKIQDFERIQVSRFELEKSRIRKTTDRGTDVGLALEAGQVLHHGDVLYNDGKSIIIEQIPEKVITIRPKSEHNTKVMIMLGHIIGNRHRPISIKDGIVSFPIQADSELETWNELFADIAQHIEIGITESIFVPHKGADVHDHS